MMGFIITAMQDWLRHYPIIHLEQIPFAAKRQEVVYLQSSWVSSSSSLKMGEKWTQKWLYASVKNGGLLYFWSFQNNILPLDLFYFVCIRKIHLWVCCYSETAPLFDRPHWQGGLCIVYCTQFLRKIDIKSTNSLKTVCNILNAYYIYIWFC